MLRQYNADQFTTSCDDGDVLGHGRHATVRLCQHKKLGTVAVKCIKCVESFSNNGLHLNSDRLISASQFTHNNIVLVHGFVKWCNSLGFVVDFVENGSLQTLLDRNVSQSDVHWDVRLRLVTQLASAITYLHEQDTRSPFVHGDIKSAGVLLTHDLHVKLCGLDLDNIGEFFTAQRPLQECKNKILLAPEMSKNTDHATCPADVFSFGAVLLEILTLKSITTSPILSHTDLSQHYEIIADLKSSMKSQQQEKDLNLLKFLENIVKICMKQDPNKRPKMSKVYSWLSRELNKRNLRDIVASVGILVEHLHSGSLSSNVSKNTTQLSNFTSPFTLCQANQKPINEKNDSSNTDTSDQQKEAFQEYESCVFIGGLFTLKEVMEYVPATKQLSPLPELAYGRWACSAACINSNIFVFGGLVEGLASDKVEYLDFNCKSLQWKMKPPMLGPRHSSVAVIVQGKIYVTGGWTVEGTIGDDDTCKTIDCCDSDGHNWQAVGRILTSRGQHAVAALQNKIYSMGGIGNANERLNSVECFDVMTKQSAYVTPMIRGSAGLASVCLDGYIYVLGGHNENHFTHNYVERFDITKQVWDTKVANMCLRRKTFGCCVVGGNIFAVAGVGRENAGKTIEVYNPVKNYWKIVCGLEKEWIYPAAVTVLRKHL